LGHLQAEESGIKHWGRVPALNTNATFIDDLADAVMEALPFVGCMATNTDSLVPIGDLETLLQVSRTAVSTTSSASSS
jgi:ferrochelatase